MFAVVANVIHRSSITALVLHKEDFTLTEHATHNQLMALLTVYVVGMVHKLFFTNI